MCCRLKSVICLVSLLIAIQVSAQPAVGRISGDVVQLDGPMLQVKTRTGDVVSARLADKTRVLTRAMGDAGHLASGQYVGVTAVPQSDGTLLASQISIFPESLRGTGEGHRPMDTLPGSTMTNATISTMPAGRFRLRENSPRPESAAGSQGNTMTNATVAQLDPGDHTRRLTLSYKEGEKIAVVPHDVPVILSEIGDRSVLVPGAHVVVYVTRQPDGLFTSERVSVRKNGMLPTS